MKIWFWLAALITPEEAASDMGSDRGCRFLIEIRSPKQRVRTQPVVCNALFIIATKGHNFSFHLRPSMRSRRCCGYPNITC